MRDGRARRFVHVVVARLIGAECAAGVSSLPVAPPTGLGEVPAQKVWWGGEGGGGRARGRVKEFFIRATGISLGSSGIDFVQVRHFEDPKARRSGRQEE